MKKTLYILATIAFAVVSCSKENAITDENESGIKTPSDGTIVIKANVDTKISSADKATTWDKDDQISVNHATAGSTSTTFDGYFTCVDASSSMFSGSFNGVTSEGSYDLYSCYPRVNNWNPASWSVTIGKPSSSNQVQEGNNSMAHLVNQGYPIYGKNTSVSGADILASNAAIPMQHLTSLLEFTVTNNGSSAITVSQITFTPSTGENLTGNFTADLTGSEPVITDNNWLTASATLVVNNPTDIAAGESAKFYMVTKPFSLTEGQYVTVATTTSAGTYTKKIVAPAAGIDFTAGKIKRIAVPAPFNALLYIPGGDRSGNRMYIGDSNTTFSSFFTNPFTIDFKFKGDTNPNGQNQNSMFFQVTGDNTGMNFFLQDGGSRGSGPYKLYWQYGNGTKFTNASNTPWTKDASAFPQATWHQNWHHYVIKYDGSNLRVYVDGYYLSVQGGVTIAAPTAYFYWLSGLNGYIKELSLWSKEIDQNLYASSSPAGTENGLVAAWDFTTVNTNLNNTVEMTDKTGNYKARIQGTYYEWQIQ